MGFGGINIDDTTFELKQSDIISGVLQEAIEAFEPVCAVATPLDTFTNIPDWTFNEAPLFACGRVCISNSKEYFIATSAMGRSQTLVAYKRSSNIFTDLKIDFGLGATTKATSCIFSHDDSHLVVGLDKTPFLKFYKRTGDTFTALSAPVGIPTDYVEDLSYSDDGIYLCAVASISPFIFMFKRSGDTYTKLTDPVGTSATGVSFAPNGNYLAVSHYASPFLRLFQRSGDVFNAMANPTQMPTVAINAITFSQDGTYLALAAQSAPYLYIYKNVGGVFTLLTAPTIPPTGVCRSVSFNGDGSILAVGHYTTPFASLYSRSGDVFTKLPNLSPLPAEDYVNDLSFSKDGSFLAVGSASLVGTTQNVCYRIYSVSGTTFTLQFAPRGNIPSHTEFSLGAMGSDFSPDGKYFALCSSPAPHARVYKVINDRFLELSLPVHQYAGVPKFSPDSKYLAFGGTSTSLAIYKIEGDVFTKLANVDVLPPGDSDKLSFSPNADYLAVAGNTTPFISIYKRTGDVFAKLANPGVLPTGTAYGAAFSPDGLHLVVSHAVTPFITIYKRSGDTFTKLANPGTIPSNKGNDVEFSKTGTYMAVASNSPAFLIYKRSGDTFTKLANPASMPAVSNSLSVSFSADELYFAIGHYTSPYITLYKRSADVFTQIANLSPITYVMARERGHFSRCGRYLKTNQNMYKRNATYQIQKASTVAGLSGKSAAGYLKTSGLTGETRDMIRLFT